VTGGARRRIRLAIALKDRLVAATCVALPAAVFDGCYAALPP